MQVLEGNEAGLSPSDHLNFLDDRPVNGEWTINRASSLLRYGDYEGLTSLESDLITSIDRTQRGLPNSNFELANLSPLAQLMSINAIQSGNLDSLGVWKNYWSSIPYGWKHLISDSPSNDNDLIFEVLECELDKDEAQIAVLEPKVQEMLKEDSKIHT